METELTKFHARKASSANNAATPPAVAVSVAVDAHSHGADQPFADKLVLPLLGAFFTIVIVLFAVSVRYGDTDAATLNQGEEGTCTAKCTLPAPCRT